MMEAVTMRKLALAVILALGLTGAGTGGPALGAGAGGDDTPKQADNPAYGQAVTLVKAGNYAGAVPLLETTVSDDPTNADALNYLGYSHRQLGDRDQALSYYQKALTLEPKHLGANEYLGELYLLEGDVSKAEERLAVLDKACFFGCEEYSELKEKIAAYKAKNGS
jgi:Flp pilus assembly protein TadD